MDINFTFSWSTRYLTSERSELVRYRVDHEKIKFISISGHVIFCLLYKHQWKRRDLLCNHSHGDLFTCEDNMLSSRVKIWSFRGKAHLVFHWCLYNKNIYLILSWFLIAIKKTGPLQLESHDQIFPLKNCIIDCSLKNVRKGKSISKSQVWNPLFIWQFKFLENLEDLYGKCCWRASGLLSNNFYDHEANLIHFLRV